MKLNEVPTELLKESLLAIADLRRKYAGLVSDSVSSCPLCQFRNKHKDGSEEGRGCEEFCPWVWLEGHDCEDYDNENGDLESYDDIPIPGRLKRIDRWESAINAEIANREAA